MCFLLGNDFLPHFPCLNIRTHGMQILMDNYNITIGKYHDRFLIDPVSSTISWKNVKLFMGSLAKREKELLLQECTARDKWDGRTWSSNTPAEVEQMILNLPMIYRQDEKYINVSENGWERRYRERLQVVDGGKDYLEGLEWVYNYYIGNRVSWRWHYKYNYTPLLIDVVKEIDVYTTREKQFSIEDTTPADNYTQLAYVLPYENLHLVPQSVQDIIKEKYLHLYPKKIEFSWAFCRFFWESKMIKH
jgi:5'-3' exonuclease